jgi:hypothetical protein
MIERSHVGRLATVPVRWVFVDPQWGQETARSDMITKASLRASRTAIGPRGCVVSGGRERE